MPSVPAPLPQLVATMLYLDSENKKDMNIYINWCVGVWVGVEGGGPDMPLCGLEWGVRVAPCGKGGFMGSRQGRQGARQRRLRQGTAAAGRPSTACPFRACPAAPRSSGGEVVPCLAIHDTMRHIKSDVGTVGFGGCMGMSGFLLAVGKKVRQAGVRRPAWQGRARQAAGPDSGDDACCLRE